MARGRRVVVYLIGSPPLRLAEVLIECMHERDTRFPGARSHLLEKSKVVARASPTFLHAPWPLFGQGLVVLLQGRLRGLLLYF